MLSIKGIRKLTSMESSKKILIYGGAFDPPHLGHARLLEEAIKTVAPDLTLVIPTGVSPHKRRSGTPYWIRYDLAKRTFLSLPGDIRISSLESKGRRNYTIQTVKKLHKLYPGSELYLLIGSDMLDSFPTWHLYKRILSRCTIVAGAREEDITDELKCDAEYLEKEGGKVILMQFSPIDISSTELRNMIKEGKDTSGFLSVYVMDQIQKKGLYR